MPALQAPPAPTHLLLPFAASADDDWLRAMQALPAGQTRHVARLLQGMRPLAAEDAGAIALYRRLGYAGLDAAATAPAPGATYFATKGF